MPLSPDLRLPDAPGNRILAALPPEDRQRLLGQMEPVELVHRTVLCEAGEPISHLYFIEAGAVSLLATLENGQDIEVGLIGRDGVIGVAAALGGETSFTEAMVQLPGHALRLPVEGLRSDPVPCRTLQPLLLKAMLRQHILVSRTAACNAKHNLVERLARWLLLLHDAAGQDELPVTHELVALLLGVRRSGVTVAVGTLEKLGAIQASRASIGVLDRDRLEAAACDCYAAGERDLAALRG